MQHAVDRDVEMTELVQLVGPPRRRWWVILVTSVVVAAAAATTGLIITRPRPKPATTAAPATPPAPPPPTPAAPPASADDGEPAPSPSEAAGSTEPAPVEAATATEPAAAASATCTFALTSSPDGADVVVAKQVVGKTPITLERRCAPFTASFKRDRYQTLTRKIAPAAGGGETEVEVRLERPTYKVRVTSTPSGAMVKLAGAEVGRTPISLTVPGFESVSVEISKPGYVAATQRVYASKAGGKVAVKLKPRRR